MNPAVSTERTSRPGLLFALVLVAIALITLWFREGETGPLHRVQALTHAATAPLSAVGEFVTTPVRAVGEWADSLSVSRAEVEEIRRQNAELRRRNAELEEARQENERLRALVGLVEARELKSEGARVIGRATTPYEQVLTIDKGADDGVAAGMPVLAEGGVLGQTIEVSDSSAKVRLIGDQKSKVAALLQRTRADGIVAGSIGGELTMEFVSRDVTVTVGDVVVTSGMGGVFPKGLLIGEVSDVEVKPSDLYPRIRVSPAVDTRRLEEVVVLTGVKPVEDTGVTE